ncbi:MAG: ChrR family anti-sigma-E factor [Proteobacteria bacterium]|nr:ChrR family anti-sigma-E factor [Pseudomonadota bacterium]
MSGHIPPEEILLGYAVGALDAAPALAVETHLALRPGTWARIEMLEAVGGAMLDGIEPAPLSSDALDRALAGIERPVAAENPPAPPPAVDAETAALVPAPLRSLVGPSIHALPWRRCGRGIEEAKLGMRGQGGNARLLRIQPGVRVPRHTHRGTELTLVLGGAYRDGGQHFAVGDMQYADAGDDHAPQADPGEPCLCLIVLEAPIRLTGPFGRFLNPIVRF